jgi:hypothetical protein
VTPAARDILIWSRVHQLKREAIETACTTADREKRAPARLHCNSPAPQLFPPERKRSRPLLIIPSRHAKLLMRCLVGRR